MRARAAIAFALLAACGGGAKKETISVPTEDEPAPGVAEDAEPAADLRLVHLKTMTESLALLAAEVERLTDTMPTSKARCTELASALVAWGDQHYEAYEVADAEGTYLGLTDADASNTELVELARDLARTSSQLVEMVDEDCLYGSGAYGAALFDYLVAYQGLAHWVREGDPAIWDYEALIAEES